MEHNAIAVKEGTTLRRALAAGVVALATFVAWPSDALAQTSGDPTLLARVPASFAATCQGAPVDGIAGADAAVTCTPPDVTSVTYAHFPTADLAVAYYDEQVGQDGRDTGSDCADIFDSESPYHTTTGGQGRVSCSMGKRTSSLSWLDDTIVATATAPALDEQSLYGWWAELVGRTFTPSQRELMQDLPGGVSRATCHDNGESSLKCWPPDVADVYVASFTQYPDAASMDAAYAALLADAGLGRDVLPPDGKGTSCAYETFWGPLRDGAVTRKLGRIACFEELDATDLVWTNKETHVLTEVEGYRPKNVFRYFQKYPGQQQTAKGSKKGGDRG